LAARDIIDLEPWGSSFVEHRSSGSNCWTHPFLTGGSKNMYVTDDTTQDPIPASRASEPRDAEGASGWPLAPSERRDFYHRIRQFPPSVNRWRQTLVRKIVAGDARFSIAADALSPKDVRALVDRQISAIREIARILGLVHEKSRLGNPLDPLDVLVYIGLSRKTREGAYQAAYRSLKHTFETWDDLLASSRDEVISCIAGGGLEERKADFLFGALRAIRDEFGACTLAPAASWEDDRLETFLCSLPEVSRKSAYCIMLFGFGREVFPVDTHVGRVLSRLGIYGDLGLDLDGKDHKQLQAMIADLVPPPLRYQLHVNLVQHGRAVCHAGKPACGECDIRKFCATYRKDCQSTASGSGAPGMIDLFSGAGGMSEGFIRAGFRPLLVVDRNPEALNTYRFNHPGVPDDRILCRDISTLKPDEIRQILGDERPEILIGSPPCQGFSSAGFRSKAAVTGYSLEEDDRNHLYRYMVNIALDLQPKLFLMENVPGMEARSVREMPFLQRAASLLREGGYSTQVWHLNAAAFGVPQDRNRIFLVAAKGVSLPGRPMGEYQDPSGNEIKDIDITSWRDPMDRLPPRRLKDAIGDLPPREPDSGTSVDAWPGEPTGTLPRFHYLVEGEIRSRSRLLFNHHVRFHNDRDLQLYARLGQGENSIHAIEVHGLEDLMRYRRDVFDDKYARLREDRPCRTIVAHLAKDGNAFIHPEQVRSISPREAARVQSFPDDFVFCGSPSDQWLQVGNAVPPMLAATIARTFIRSLAAGTRKGKML